MKSFQYQIKEEASINDGTVGLLVKEAVKVESTVILECNGKTGDAKRLFNVMGMGIQKGDNVAVLIEGKDETNVAESLETFFHENF